MTLVELMVAMSIGLGITLAVTSLLIASENHKRVSTSTNDAQQSGAYGFYALDKVLRGAGSAVAQTAYPSDLGALGCRLNVRASQYPRNSAFPAPFSNFLAGVTNTLRIAPVLIAPGISQAGSDVIMVTGGSGSAGGVSRQVTGGGNATSVTLDNTVGFANDDLLLVSQSGITDCLLEQVSRITSPTLNLGGTYYTAGASTSMSTFAGSTSTYVTPIGNATANNVHLLLFGVGVNQTLFSYDLLQNLQLVGGSGGDTSQALADGIVTMHAIYGVDTNGDAIQDSWASPSDAGWDIATVMNSAAKMRQIISVRIALVAQGEYYEKSVVQQPPIIIFNGLTSGAGTVLTQNITNTFALDQHFRYRQFEFTVPLRNMILLAGGG